jgi:MYXO-CTERM domain-containing protein
MRGALVAALLLCAGAARGGPTGRKWADTSIPVPYSVYSHTSINGVSDFRATALPAIQRGMARWNASQVACTRWSTTYTGTFTTPSGIAAIKPSDKLNRIIWLSGPDWAHGPNTLGLTIVTFTAGTGQILDADIQMNGDRVWKVGGASGDVDVESIITHEAGHFLGLDHSPVVEAVMHAVYPFGSIKFQLAQDDVQNVCAVYPAQPATGAQGAFCETDLNCSSTAPMCRGAPDSSDSAICTTECTDDLQCPVGYACMTTNVSDAACLKAGGASDLCRFCSSGPQCSTGHCVTDGRHNWCTNTCATASDCGNGFDCVESGEARVCTPSGGVCPTPQCFKAADCAVGFTCTAAGMCEATGGLGDRCEVSGFCQSCSTCVGTPQEAYCRACCGGAGQCQGCPSSTCSSTTLVCEQLPDTDERACVPGSSTATSCQACDSTRPCAAGLTCFNGRCRPFCNPEHPGNCGACGTLPNGSGVCACPDEVATTGELCGVLEDGRVAICAEGHSCVGSPRRCYQPCNQLYVNACGPGMRCESVDGATVCIASEQQGTRCNSCREGTCDDGSVCHAGRCYAACDPKAPVCTSCVDLGGGKGVCPCADQRSSAGGGCSSSTTDIRVCTTGHRCVDGTCRMDCEPSNPSCGPSERCVATSTQAVCMPGGALPNLDAGTPPPPGPGAVKDAGCGCTSASPALWPAALLGLMAAGRRRRRSLPPPEEQSQAVRPG